MRFDTEPTSEYGESCPCTPVDDVRACVCGMTVDRHAAQHTSRWHGDTIYFCCAGRREAFEAEPDRDAELASP